MSEVGVAELARQVRDVLLRFQTLAERLDNTYLTKEVFALYKQLVDTTLANIEKELETTAKNAVADELKKVKADRTELQGLNDRIASKADSLTVENNSKRLDALEDNMKWAVRLVLGLVILTVVGLALATGNVPNG